jgi:3-hydroxyacyl-[acyl-carrier-protein] dehydratase
MPRLDALFVIGHAHPALPGHFPGQPVVPGVVILDQVLALLTSAYGVDTGWLDLPQVKFAEPLLPGQIARIETDIEADRARFRVLRDSTVVASGSLHWRTSP